MRSKYFQIHEIVPANLFNLVHEDLLWRMIDDRLVETIDTIKEKFPNGSMTINNYKWNGSRGWSGIRTTDSPWYSKGSQHTLGMAIDAVFSKYSTDEVRNYIVANPKEFPHIRRIEAGVDWLHFDMKETGKEEIVTFNP